MNTDKKDKFDEVSGFYDKDGKFVEYVMAWFCNENKIIHNSKKEARSCKYCNPPK